MILGKTYRFKVVIAALILCIAQFSLNAQRLRIENIQVPDSVLLGSNITAGFSIVNDDTSGQLGDLRIWFGNSDLANSAAPLGFFASRQFFSAGQIREFIITLPISPEIFKGGGNTVVIWPSFIDRPEIAADSTFLEIFVINPNSSTGIAAISGNLKILHLPESDVLEVRSTELLSQPESLVLMDACGRFIKTGPGNQLTLSEIGEGIYILEVRFSEGIVTRHQIYWLPR